MKPAAEKTQALDSHSTSSSMGAFASLRHTRRRLLLAASSASPWMVVGASSLLTHKAPLATCMREHKHEPLAERRNVNPVACDMSNLALCGAEPSWDCRIQWTTSNECGVRVHPLNEQVLLRQGEALGNIAPQHGVGVQRWYDGSW